MMSGLHTDVQLVRRVQRKLERLERQCSERYQLREAKVLNTIGFCVSTLEQLQNWATFAIFPQDEGHSDRYLNFVEFKYKCIIEPLRTLYTSMFHCDPPRSEGGIENGGRSPDQESVVDSLPAGADARSLLHNRDESDLRYIIEKMSGKYIFEGQTIRDEVEKRLDKNRKDIRLLYNWGQTSLMDLHDLLDETLADELYFSVRGKMARILCSMSEVEETSDKIEKTLVSQLEGNLEMKSYDSKSDGRSDHSGHSGAVRSHQEQAIQHNHVVESNQDYPNRERIHEEQNEQRYDNSSDNHQVLHYNPDSYGEYSRKSPERQQRASRDRSAERERARSRSSDRPPPPVPPLWSSSDEAPHPNSQPKTSKSERFNQDRQSPTGRRRRSPGSGRSPSPGDGRHQMYPRQHSAPNLDQYARPQTAPPGPIQDTYYPEVPNSRQADINDPRYVEIKDAKSIPPDFPQPGSILRARSEQSRDEQFNPERPNSLNVRDKNDANFRSKSVSLDRDPYRPPLQKQDSVIDGKIPVSDYPPLPTKDQNQRQSSVLESSAYPGLPGQKSLSDRGDYRRTNSQSSLDGDFNTSSSREVGRPPPVRDIESVDNTSGTPEPPTSPRPRGLANHPKIVKDMMLQSFSLPNKFLQNTW